MTTLPDSQRPALAIRLVGALVVCALAVHIATNLWGPYGIHRDEFLYLSMGKHLRFWRMDFPPLIALAANFSRWIGGDTIVAIRLLPSLAHGGLILLAALAAREFGAHRAGQTLAAAGVLLSPLFLRTGGMLQPVIFDQLWWTLTLYACLRLINSGRAECWLVIGSALGAGLLTKFSIAFLGVPFVVALFLSTERRWRATRWPWIALALALAIGAPSLVGQVALGFPIRGQMEALQGGQLDRMTYGAFIGGQLLFGPATFLAAFGCASLIWGQLSRYRLIGLSCLGAFLFLLVLHGKSYYIGPIYPVLYAAAAARLEMMRAPKARRGAFAVSFAAIAAYGIVIFPVGVPFLSPQPMARYAQWLGISQATETNQGVQLALPQDYADMLGWREMV
ncbi:MAG: glycosyltransferase family 39 protein, partial [Gemmatimonadaceae bacterium]